MRDEDGEDIPAGSSAPRLLARAPDVSRMLDRLEKQGAEYRGCVLWASEGEADERVMGAIERDDRVVGRRGEGMGHEPFSDARRASCA